ncbi:hypothetical protein [Bacillus cereus]|uniref:hypothetical protein n=1 Tax=Bacillus cereus TaxID=1396 RepID=UPI00032E4E1D|nr:hypothetical protein [Bacillus cereus]EOO44205.1 hypothetical protein ICK_06462 [Bacillus cereus BAG1X2-2]EOP00396.1 hypothetical protein ICO_06352 [Bacillus cereus BAG2O-1]
MKEWLYNSYFGYKLSQMKWFRKWYGGTWHKIIPKPFPYMHFWAREYYVNREMEIITNTEEY